MRHLRRVINLNYLTTLSGGNTRLIVDMIKLFISETTKEIQLIEKGIIENDLILIKSSIHSMKGIIYYVGLDEIIKTDLIKIEKLAINELSILEIGILFSKTKTKLKEAIHELNDWISLLNVQKTCE